MPRRRSQRPSDVDEERVVITSDEDENMLDETQIRDGTSSLPDGGFSALAEEQQDELVKRMIRYMVCRNTRKKPVKRAELSKHIFSNMSNIRSKGKVFQGTYMTAQTQLRALLGMEMVEIVKQVRTRTGTSRSQSASATQGATQGMKAFILASVLPQEGRVEDVAEMASIGFLTVIASFILLEPGCRIEQEALYRALGRIGVKVQEKGGHRQLNGGNVKELIESELPSQWYLEREREDKTFYYTLGPRLRAELEDNDLLAFIEAVLREGGRADTTLDESSRHELQLRLDEARGKIAGDEEAE